MTKYFGEKGYTVVEEPSGINPDLVFITQGYDHFAYGLKDFPKALGYYAPYYAFPHRLATLMRRGARTKPRYFFIYICLRFNCVGVAYLISKIYSILSGRNLDAKGKTLLE